MSELGPTPSPLYAAVLHQLRNSAGESRTLEHVGVNAWNVVAPRLRANELPFVLGVYVSRVIEEQRAREHAREARDPNIHSYLDDDDTSSAWDSYHAKDGDAPGVHETVIDREVLLRILCELELIRHRLDMAKQPKK